MKNLLSNYLDKRLDASNTICGSTQKSGPVITISREVGCNGLILAKALAVELDKTSNGHKWKVLSKEIFHECAKELNLDYNRIIKFYKNTQRYTLEEILYAFNNKNYKSERKIIRTVVDVIHSFAVEGHCIFVGRASHIITRDIKNSLHIRLVAPLDYRINTIMQNNNLTREKAIEFIHKVENERAAYRKALNEGGIREEDFHLILNRGWFDNGQLIDIILETVRIKNLLAKAKEEVFLF